MEILKENLQENLEDIDYCVGNKSKHTPKESLSNGAMTGDGTKTEN
jgi:hypothetical protein